MADSAGKKGKLEQIPRSFSKELEAESETRIIV